LTELCILLGLTEHNSFLHAVCRTNATYVQIDHSLCQTYKLTTQPNSANVYHFCRLQKYMDKCKKHLVDFIDKIL